ncbi:MAG: hypothetical protein M1838_000014 [Thelocarpon superellum]|nr:MAG: hypothetical protein M1838_000014 [Thelocarpon superellum]
MSSDERDASKETKEFTPAETRLILIAFKHMTGTPEIDFEKVAQEYGYKNKTLARSKYTNAKSKLSKSMGIAPVAKGRGRTTKAATDKTTAKGSATAKVTKAKGTGVKAKGTGAKRGPKSKSDVLVKDEDKVLDDGEIHTENSEPAATGDHGSEEWPPTPGFPASEAMALSEGQGDLSMGNGVEKQVAEVSAAPLLG